MNTRVSGAFDVKMTPQAIETPTLGRFTLDKQYHGDLQAASTGEMLSVGTTVKDSAGYVAIERVSGALQGRKGTFALQHTATMNRGVPDLSITVVPDSGTEELAGLSGRMGIRIVEGKHFYDFDFVLS
jgi:Protein of unknown function (DUF3224)